MPLAYLIKAIFHLDNKCSEIHTINTYFHYIDPWIKVTAELYIASDSHHEVNIIGHVCLFMKPQLPPPVNYYLTNNKAFTSTIDHQINY